MKIVKKIIFIIILVSISIGLLIIENRKSLEEVTLEQKNYLTDEKENEIFN